MQKQAIELKVFLETGILGKLNIQLQVENVLTLLGKPDWVKEEDFVDSSHLVRFTYDNLEIDFLDNEMYLIEITYKYPPTRDGIPIILDVTWYYWLKGKSYEDFKTYLNENEIYGKRVVFDHPNEGLSQLLEIQATGIQVLFDEHGIIEQLIYVPTRPGRYKYEEL